jgi:YD repeat-containing protein
LIKKVDVIAGDDFGDRVMTYTYQSDSAATVSSDWEGDGVIDESYPVAVLKRENPITQNEFLTTEVRFSGEDSPAGYRRPIFDDEDRLLRLEISTEPGGEVLATVEYTYDENGNLIHSEMHDVPGASSGPPFRQSTMDYSGSCYE